MSTHVLFDKPDIDQHQSLLLLYVDGSLPSAKPGLAYEGRLQIHNNVGDCTVQQIGGASLPPGSTITVDNATSQVVVAWPAYDSGIFNADFEQGAAGWEPGFGWEIGTTSPPTPAPESGGQCGKYLRKGEAYIRRASWDAVTPGQSLTARARINPVNKRSGSQGLVNIEWYDGSRTMISRAVGSLVEYGDEWEWSAVTSVNPGNAEFAKISVLGKHAITGRNGWQTRPVLLDRVEWNYPSSGVNTDATYCITLRVRDSAGRTADWSGCIVVVDAQYWDSTITWYKFLDGFFEADQMARSQLVGVLNAVSAKARGPTGKWYAEFQGLPDAHGGNNIWPSNVEVPAIGLVASTWEQSPIFNGTFADHPTSSDGVSYSTNRRIRRTGTVLGFGTGLTPGIGGFGSDNNGSRRCMVAWNSDTGDIWFGVDGVWTNSGDPYTGVAPTATGIVGSHRLAAAVSSARSCHVFTLGSEFLFVPPIGFSPWE